MANAPRCRPGPGADRDSHRAGAGQVPGATGTRSPDRGRAVAIHDVLAARACWGGMSQAWCQHVGVRPALKAGLLPVWRDRDTLQFGVDPRRAVAVAGLGQTAAVLSLLDGSRDRDGGDRRRAGLRRARPRRPGGCSRCWPRRGCSTTSRPGRTARCPRRCGPGWRRRWPPPRWPTRTGTAGRACWPAVGPPTSGCTARAGPARAWPASWPPPASATSAAPTRNRPSPPTSRPPG